MMVVVIQFFICKEVPAVLVIKVDVDYEDDITSLVNEYGCGDEKSLAVILVIKTS